MTERSIAIQHIGVAGALGTGFAGAKIGYASGLRPFRREPAIVGVDGLPTTICPVLPYAVQGHYGIRIGELFRLALVDLGLGDRAVPLRLMLPAWIESNPVRDDIVSVLASAAGGQTPELSFGGPAEALSLIGYAATAVLNGDIDEVVVGAVDSFMHWTLLDRLAIAGRLLFNGNAYGAVPGEAACLVHLVAGTTTAPVPPGIGQVLAVFRGQEMENVSQPQTIVGQGLAAAFRQASEYVAVDRLLSDMNGERWRAEEFGFAVSAAGGTFAELSDRVEVPALHIGDCGTAAGPMLLALAMGDAPSRTHGETGPLALLSASSATGRRAAMIVERFSSGAGP